MAQSSNGYFFKQRLIKLLILAFAPVTLLLVAPIASAHVLKSDGSMTAELHIEPDDAPVAQTPFTYRLEFNESQGDFSLQTCTCAVEFIAGGQTVARQSLAATQATLSEDTITLPRPDSYTFRVTGAPKSGAAFAPFTLNYQVRLGSGQTEEPLSPLAWIGIGLAVLLLLAVAAMSAFRNHRNGRR